MTGREKSAKLTPQHLEQLARFSRMVERHLKRVGRAIEIRRLELGLSRPQLARLIPVADKTIERWEKGLSGGADAQLDRVAEVMNTTSQAMIAAALAEEQDAEVIEEVVANPSGATDDELRALRAEVAQLRTELLAAMETLGRRVQASQRKPQERGGRRASGKNS